jgi:hypothetical protein
MKSLKTFIKESTEMGHVVNGVPCAIVDFPRNRSVSESFPHWAGKGRKADINDWLNDNDNESHGGVSGVHDTLSEHDKHDEDDAESIRHYTENSTLMNRRLYREHTTGTSSPHPMAMDGVIKKNSLPHDLHVYSGVKWNPGEVAAKHPEGHVHLPAFTSTSTDPYVAHGFARDHAINKATTNSHEHTENHIIHFHLKEGQTAKYVGHTSEVKDEHEVILPRNTTIKVHPTPDTYEDEYSGEKTHVWHAHTV